jgi:hypothetical protein
MSRRKYACGVITYYGTFGNTIISTTYRAYLLLLLLMYQKVASFFLGCSLLDSNGEWIIFFAIANFDYFTIH